ncbi:MAG: alanine/glycine:cation symporter family protein [Pirellulaceae bacterium]
MPDRRWIVLWTLTLLLAYPTATWSQETIPETATPETATALDDTSADHSATDATPPAATTSDAKSDAGVGGWQKTIDDFFGKYLVAPLASVLMFDVVRVFFPKLEAGVPLVVIWLFGGAIFFTIRMGFVNVRYFGHAVRVTKGDYDDPQDVGEVTHFQALASALSATVGLGNIAGVAIAVGTGGPGAIFWMIVCGLLGMTSKFTECTLAQMYRRVDSDGRVLGGPMRYLRDGLSEMGLAPLGSLLAVLFTILCIGGSFGGGCTFQVVQSMGIVREYFPILQTQSWIYGLVMSILVGIVIVGGIRRIGATAEKLVPAMCLIYVVTSLAVLALDYDRIPWAFGQIFSEAFQLKSAYGGILGVMVVGIKRASFSNEAGVGSAAIAHSAAKTAYPVREGIVALLEPFIDTVVICTMTGLVIVITKAYDTKIYPDHSAIIAANQGAQLTSNAFRTVVPWFPKILAVAATLFAYSTMISWSYYGERCWTNLFGERASMVYRILFLAFVFLGSIITATNILDFSDLMILSMAFPNILGLILLSGKVRRALDEYASELKAGKIVRHR